MSIKKIITVTLACAAFVGGAFGQAVDPCEQNTPLTGGTALGLSDGKDDQGMGPLAGTDFHYEFWFNKGENSNPTYTMKWYGADKGGGAAFASTWNNQGRVNILARIGYYWGGHNTNTYHAYKNIYCDYNIAVEGANENWSYFGIYGWSKNPSAASSENQLIEFYIVDNWLASSQLGPSTVCGGQQCERGSFEVDGATYKIYTNIQRGQPSIDGNKDFLQIFSVRQYTTNTGPSSRKRCGSISVTEHFKKWEEVLTLEIGGLYEVKFKAETGGGTGSFDARYLTFSQEDFPRGAISSGQRGLAVWPTPHSGGSVTQTPVGYSHANNASVTLEAKPATGWKFSGWSGDLEGNTNPAQVTMNANKVIYANFMPDVDLSTNQIKDGDFPNANVLTTNNSNSSASWSLNSGSYFGGGNDNVQATGSISNGKIDITGIGIGNDIYKPQLTQRNLTLVKDVTYKLTFTAKATASKTLEVGFQEVGGEWKTWHDKKFDLTTAEEEYTFVFKMEGPTSNVMQVAFNLGDNTAGVTIGNVVLVEGGNTSIAPRHSLSSVAETRGLRVSAKKSAVSVKFKAKSTGATELRLYGLKGEVVAKANINTVAGKNYAHTFNAAKLPNGVYVVSVRGDGKAERSRVIMPK